MQQLFPWAHKKYKIQTKNLAIDVGIEPRPLRYQYVAVPYS